MHFSRSGSLRSLRPSRPWRPPEWKKILSDEVVMSHGSSSVVLQCIWKLQIHWSMKSFWVEFRGLRYTTAVASTTVWTHLYNFPRPAPPLKIVSPLTIRPTICQNGQLVSLFFLGHKNIWFFFQWSISFKKNPTYFTVCFKKTSWNSLRFELFQPLQRSSSY